MLLVIISSLWVVFWILTTKYCLVKATKYGQRHPLTAIMGFICGLLFPIFWIGYAIVELVRLLRSK